MAISDIAIHTAAAGLRLETIDGFVSVPERGASFKYFQYLVFTHSFS